MQTVNLYLPEYRPKREWLSLRYSLALFMSVVAVLIGMQIDKSRQLQQLDQRVAVLQQQEAAVKQQIDELKKKVSSSDKPRLQKQVQELRAAIDNRGAIKNVMSGDSMGNRRGFSEHLYVLGERRSEDLVLKRFLLSYGGEYVELEGITDTPSSVPMYVHRLQQSSSFRDAKFGALTISELGGLAHFRLSGGGSNEGDALQLHSDKKLRK